MASSVRIGTSGFVYPHWKGRFYPAELPAREWLPFFAAHFDTVELNTTFYRLPTRKSVEGWAEATPRRFLFAVKGSRYLTHVKRLKEPGEGLRRFFEALEPLLPRVGPVLWQLPPRMKPDVGRLTAFLEALPRGRLRHVVEFREPAWYSEEVFEALADHGASLCVHDLVAAEAPFPPPGPIYYRRFHGAQARYSGRYGAQGLAGAARQLVPLAEAGTPCFAYFNNDAFAHAVSDALELRGQVSQLLGERAGHPPGATV